MVCKVQGKMQRKMRLSKEGKRKGFGLLMDMMILHDGCVHYCNCYQRLYTAVHHQLMMQADVKHVLLCGMHGSLRIVHNDVGTRQSVRAYQRAAQPRQHQSHRYLRGSNCPEVAQCCKNMPGSGHAGRSGLCDR